MVTTEENIFPVYFQLIETIGPKTELTINEIKQQSIEFGVEDLVELTAFVKGGGGEGNNILVYKVNTIPTDIGNPLNSGVLSFLDFVFKRFKDRYPSYVEPPE